MAKTTRTSRPPNPGPCKVHGKEREWSNVAMDWVCRDCLFNSFVTQESLNAAQKKYNHSAKHKTAEGKYEDSDKGRAARKKYFQSEKYKAARRRYNERLKESLAIARAARDGKEKPYTAAEQARGDSGLTSLVQDVREYYDSMGRTPGTLEVVEWANDVYHLNISIDQAKQIIEQGSKHQNGK